MLYTEETTSFLEETLCRFISDNDLWSEYNQDREKVHQAFIIYCNEVLPGISIT